MKTKKTKASEEFEFSEKEIEDAMSEVEGFIDITPDDFKQIYHIAYKNAAARKIERKDHRVEEVREKSKLLKILRPVSEPAPMVHFKDIAWSWITAFIGIGLVSWIHYSYFSSMDMIFIVGSFGASAVLIYGAIKSPLAQPRNFIGGHFFSAIAGVISWQIFSAFPWFAAAVAVATAIAFMHLTRTVHPPGGATALIAVIGGPSIHNLGFGYVFLPILSGALTMLAVALILNNLVNWRKYPEFWI